MSKKKTKEEFIEEANLVHDNIFDYSKVNYKGGKVKVIIICNNGHEFEQIPNNHLRGKACKRCFEDRRNKIKEERIKNKTNNKKSQEELNSNFKQKGVKKHGDNFNYDLVHYVDSTTKVRLICKRNNHTFEQSPTNHIQGFGCIYCARIDQANSKRKDLNYFLKKFYLKHKNTYSYEESVYVESNKKIKIRCDYHGIFEQTPNAHASGKGCDKCARINNSFVREDYVKMAKGRDTTLYIIKCFNDNEEFYKIGKTYLTIKERYKKNEMPYEYDIIETFISDASTIHILEASLHKKYGEYSYKPNNLFGGYTECYSIDLPLKNVLKL